MSRFYLGLFLALSLFSNTSLADVRLAEHPVAAIFQNFEHVYLPDLLDSLLPPLSRAGDLPFGGEPLRAVEPLLMPADGSINSLVGWRIDPLTGVRRFHAGIDIANLRNSLVRASAKGCIVFAGRAAGCGLMVEIDHGRGLKTKYCHLDGFTVVRGEGVEAGEPIGLMGATGRTTGTHLHFELLISGVASDPTPHLVF